MGLHRSFVACFLSAIVTFTYARPGQQYRHEAQIIAPERRQAPSPVPASTTSTSEEVPATTSASVLTYITPSPGATPVPVTEESQLVTSYIAQFTLCDLPPQAVFPVTPLVSPTSAPWRNYSISIPPGNGTCETIYSPTQTMVCATTLTGLVNKYTVSECDQDITFSTEYGYVLASPTAAANVTSSGTGTAVITPKPTIQTITTYQLAPWQALTDGLTPEEVILKVCATYANGTEECIRQYEVWHTSLVTQMTTLTKFLNISTTVHGPSQVVIDTITGNVTQQLTTISMSTEIEKEYVTEVETTERERATSTSTRTVTVERASSSSSALKGGSVSVGPSETEDSTSTRTSTIKLTTTVYSGTSTSTLSDAAAVVTAAPAPEAAASADDAAAAEPTASDDPNWASMLGIESAEARAKATA